MSDDIVDKGALVRAGRMASGEFYVELDGKRLVREDGELITSLRAEVARLTLVLEVIRNGVIEPHQVAKNALRAVLPESK